MKDTNKETIRIDVVEDIILSENRKSIPTRKKNIDTKINNFIADDIDIDDLIKKINMPNLANDVCFKQKCMNYGLSQEKTFKIISYIEKKRELKEFKNNLEIEIKSDNKISISHSNYLNEIEYSKINPLINIFLFLKGTILNGTKIMDSGQYVVLQLFGSQKNVSKVYEKESAKLMARKEIKEVQLNLVKNEVFLYSKINKIDKKHRFLQLYNVLKDNSNNTYLIHMECGDINLGEILEERKKQGKKYNLREVLYIFRSLVEDLLFLQENGIANRDIKLENIILVANDQINNKFSYKIADFGIGFLLNKDRESDNIYIKYIDGFSNNYVSPEVKSFYQEKDKPLLYDPFKADVYSLGILIYKLLDIDFVLEDFINKLEYKNHTLYDIIVEMTRKDPEERKDFSYVKKSLETLEKKSEKFDHPNEREYLRGNLKGEIIKNNNDQNIDEKIKELLEQHNYYYNNSLFFKAEEILNVCHEIYSQNENNKTLIDTEIVGRLFFELGRFNHLINKNYNKAKQFYKKSLEVISKFKNQEIVTYYNSIAVFYLNIMKNYDKAKELFKKSLKIQKEKTNGIYSNEIAETYKNLVSIYINKRKYLKAEDFCNEIKKIEEKKFGDDKINFSQIYYEIANLYHYMEKNHQEAKKFYDKSLEIRKQQLQNNEENKETAHFYFDMAECYNFYYINKEDYKIIYFEKTEEFYKKCLQIQEKIFKTFNKEIAKTFDSLAYLYVKVKKFEQAEEFFEKIIIKQVENVGTNNIEQIELARSYYSLGIFYHYHKKDYEKARKYYNECKKIRENNYCEYENDQFQDFSNHLSNLSEIEKKMKNSKTTKKNSCFSFFK